ncbi:MAG: Xaa-Pro dipeptidase [Saprospiraceae bacterium]|jgi:Xaa-Pro dipeptidase
MFSQRLEVLQTHLVDANIDVALITDDDSVYYYTGYYDYLHMEFGRPTLLVVPSVGETLLITPSMEMDMATAAARVSEISVWNDGMGMEWRERLPGALKSAKLVALELNQMPTIVRKYIDQLIALDQIVDVMPMVAQMRMIKSAEELQLARHAAAVSNTMMVAGREAMGAGVPEFEVALAISAAGTRKAAALLSAHYDDNCMSPNTHFLQIMASGKEITKPHHRASTRVIQHGEPVFLCFCGMTNFHRFKLGFDRTFWVGDIADNSQRAVYETAVESQAAALKILGPGVTAEDVHGVYAEVIQSAGYEYPFRCGRATGFSYLESPQLVYGDKTILEPGMVLAVDGSVTVAQSFRAQVGDSFIITDTGFEQITQHPKAIEEMIV